MKRYLFLLIFAGLAVIGLSAQERSNLSGREIVDQGTLGTISGVLTEADGEWFLESSEQSWAVHFGFVDYLEQVGFNPYEGAQAEIAGFMVQNDISVTTAEIDGRLWVFRDEDGRPAWSGSGRGRNRDE